MHVLNRHLPNVANVGHDFDTSHNCGNSIQPKVECSKAHTNRRHESRDDDDVVAVAVFLVRRFIRGTREERQTESKRRIFISGTVVNGIHPT